MTNCKKMYVLPQLEPITFERVQALQQLPVDQTRRKCFEKSGIQERKARPTFSVNFQESIKAIYEAMMLPYGFELQYSNTLHNYWHYVKKEDIEKIKEWERGQGSRMFIRDNLSISIALASYSTDPAEHHRTTIGELVYQAKYQGNADAIQGLAGRCVETIRSLPYYRKAQCICAVPPSSTKTRRDLPSEITALVAKELEIENITSNFKYHGTKPELKGLKLEEKWPGLKAADLRYEGKKLNGKKVILVDDLYQSGTTMQFVGMKLHEAGAHHVYGLSMAKNLSDDDNQ